MVGILRPALTLLALSTVALGLVYPAAVTGFAQLAFPGQANGSIIGLDSGRTGSMLVGQSFAGPGFFWGRPSATAPTPYNASASGASNFGPLNPALRDAVAKRVAALHAADPGNALPIPIDLVTASGSGLDPHISPAAAIYQAERVARARGLPVSEVRRLVNENVEDVPFGLFGEPRVNVLILNLAVARMAEDGGQ